MTKWEALLGVVKSFNNKGRPGLALGAVAFFMTPSALTIVMALLWLRNLE